MLRREPTGGTLYHAYAKSVENLDANFTNKMAANYLQNCNIPNTIIIFSYTCSDERVFVPVHLH